MNSPRLAWLTEEIKFLIMLGTFMASIVFAYSKLHEQQALLTQRVDIIETNHLVHIQTDIKEMKQDVKQILSIINNR